MKNQKVDLMVNFTNSNNLIETTWLESHLNDPNLRILDCTVLLSPDEEGNLTNKGREVWEKGHIPGSAYVNLVKELSDANNPLPFMMPSQEQFAEVMSRLGVGEGTKVLLYDASSDNWAHIWAARVWWMLRVFGFDNVAVLNGGWYKWVLEKREVSTQEPRFSPSSFIPQMRPELIASKEEVLANIKNAGTCLINALTAEEYAGAKARYGRAGHIPSSVNVPTVSLIDPATHAYLPIDQLKLQFDAVGAFKKERVITYCGGGIAASSDAFILTLLGKTNVAVYDGSLLEWANDSDLPMEVSE